MRKMRQNEMEWACARKVGACPQGAHKVPTRCAKALVMAANSCAEGAHCKSERAYVLQALRALFASRFFAQIRPPSKDGP